MNSQIRTVYARITALTQNEQFLDCIEGRITSGSVNVDGASAVRRTCQLSLVSDVVNIADYYWALQTKFKLEVGIRDDNEQEITWYPQGIYIITSFSSSFNTNSYTINISGKDKMCLLNGENGGLLSSQVDFGQIDLYDAKGNHTIQKRKLKDIIRDAVYFYGREPLHNILIQDLEDGGLEIQTYRHSEPLYLLKYATATEYIQATFDKTVYRNGKAIMLSQLDNYDRDTIFTTGVDQGDEFQLDPSSSTKYTAKRIAYGQSPGYIAHDLNYTGDLIANAGESITSILDKIKNMLGDFEYFYDIDGTFIFRRQQSYINVAFSPLEPTDEDNFYIDPYKMECQYNFSGNRLITAFSNNPNLSNLKNDYTIWGTRKSVTGKELAAHLRYAIDVKPYIYKNYQGVVFEARDYASINKRSMFRMKRAIEYPSYYDPEAGTVTFEISALAAYDRELGYLTLNAIPEGYDAETKIVTLTNVKAVSKVDWREIIYQMAKDYYDHHDEDDFELVIANNNPHYPDGQTGYEQYYLDMQGFWRQLYSITPVYTRAYDVNEDNYRTYYVKTEKGAYIHPEVYTAAQHYYTIDDSYYPYNHPEYPYWNKKVIEEPEMLDFWFDFLDSSGDLAAYSVKAIGPRPKVVNDKDVKAIYYRDIPSITWSNNLNIRAEKTEAILQIPENYKVMFSASSQGKSAIDALNSLLQAHACVTESINITTIPVYSLEPNKKIFVEDINSGISGEYLVSKITVPLQYNGTMQITATKVIDRIL